ncbi:MAG TPA: PAS domain-containing protein, partial [Candidatus Limnocylindrales bacterium]
MTTPDSLSGHRELLRSDGAADGSRPRLLTARPSDFGRFSLVLSLAVVAIGLSVLIGWTSGTSLLTSWLPGLVQAKVNSAVCLIGLGLALSVGSARGGAALWLRWGAAGLVLAVAGITVFEHLAGVLGGIDQVVFQDLASASLPYPGRFGLQNGVAFLSAAVAILVLGRRVRAVYASEALALVCGAVGGISLLGYMFGAPGFLSTGSVAQVSLPDSVALILMSAALVSASPEHTLVRLMADVGIAGQVMRRFLLPALLVVPVGAWLRLAGERMGLYDETVGLAIMVVFEALILLAVGAWTTTRVRRLEEERYEVMADLIRLGSAASTPLIQTAPVGLAVLDRDLRYLYVNPALASMGGVSVLASLGQPITRLLPAFAGEAELALTGVCRDGVPIRDLEISGETRTDGQSGTWLSSAEAIRDEEDEIIGLTISVVDITERKHREEALAAVAELQRQAQAIGESIPFGIWLAERDGRIRYLSESFLAMTGQTMGQARDSGWMTKLAPEIAEQARTDWAGTVLARV